MNAEMECYTLSNFKNEYTARKISYYEMGTRIADGMENESED